MVLLRDGFIAVRKILSRQYLKLRSRIDRFARQVMSRYPDFIKCEPGCCECCIAGLTVTIVEAVIIGEGLGISQDRVFLMAGQPPISNNGNCVFLNKDGLCSIYDRRPVVCRTQGLPLKYEDKKNYLICEKNSMTKSLHESFVFNATNSDRALFAVNMEYCQSKDLNSISRVPLDRLASLTGDNH